MSLFIPSSRSEAVRSNRIAIPFAVPPLVLHMVLMYRLYFTSEVYITLIPVALVLSIPLAALLFSRAIAPGMGFHGTKLRFIHKFSIWFGSAALIYVWALTAYGLPVLLPPYAIETKEFRVEAFRTCNTGCYWCDHTVQLSNWVGSPTAEFCVPNDLSSNLGAGDLVKIDGYFSNNAAFVVALRNGG